MKIEIKTTDHRKRTNFLYAYGFGIYSDDAKIQTLFNEIKYAGRAKSFEIETGDEDFEKDRILINNEALDCIEAEDLEFIHKNQDEIALVYVKAEVIPKGDEHYNLDGFRKISDSHLYLNVEIYYFDKVLSREKRDNIIKKELGETKQLHGREKKSFRERDVRMITVLNIALVIVCILLTIYCYTKDMKSYGILMIAFAFFFAVWGRKFFRAKKQ